MWNISRRQDSLPNSLQVRAAIEEARGAVRLHALLCSQRACRPPSTHRDDHGGALANLARLAIRVDFAQLQAPGERGQCCSHGNPVATLTLQPGKVKSLTSPQIYAS